MKTIQNWNQFNENIKDYVGKIRKAYDGKDTDVKTIADTLDLSTSQVIDIIRLDLKHTEVADELEAKYKKGSTKSKKSESETIILDQDRRRKEEEKPKPRPAKAAKSGKSTIYEMTGSPRSAMQMLPPKERTKAVFSEALSKYDYVWGRLGKNCDLLVVGDLKEQSVKMKKAHELGIQVMTYESLIKKHKLFKDNESIEYNDEVGTLELWWDGKGPSTWFFITDAIKDGIMEEKLQLDDDMLQGFAEYLVGLGEIEEDSVEWFDMEELSVMIEQDFESTLNNLFDWLMEENMIDHKPSVEIHGEDEEGEEYDFSYSPENNK